MLLIFPRFPSMRRLRYASSFVEGSTVNIQIGGYLIVMEKLTFFRDGWVCKLGSGFEVVFALKITKRSVLF